MDMFEHIQAWHWSTLGIILVMSETCGFGKYLSNIGGGALFTSILLLINPALPLQYQLICTLIVCIALFIIRYVYFKPPQPMAEVCQSRQKDALAMIGHKLRLEYDLRSGHGKIRIGDALWAVKAKRDLLRGQDLIIEDIEGLTLVIDAAHGSHKLSPVSQT